VPADFGGQVCWRKPHALQHLLADDSQPQITEERRRTRPMVGFINVQSVDPVIYAVFNEDWKNQTIVMGFVVIPTERSRVRALLGARAIQRGIPHSGLQRALSLAELPRNGSAERCGFFCLFSVPRKTIIQAAQGQRNSLVCSRLLPIRAVEHPEQAFHMDRNRRHFPHASQRLQRRLPSILRK
jgi:hypothetical protein